MKKIDRQDRSERIPHFWLCAGLLAILVSSILSRDITRPFYGLHSWGQAHDAWVARSHVKYGLRYTKCFDTFAVGSPPGKNAGRYLDHPVLFGLLDALAMVIFGINTWALRITNLLATVIALLLFLKILRGLLDDISALLAGLLFCLFPLIGYFGVNQWLYPLSFSAIWCYLVLIESLKDGPVPKEFHKGVLAASLFLALQMTWEGFFFALAIGVHYVFRCIHRRQLPDKTLLTILIAAPLSSLVLVLLILAGGGNWDFQRIIELAKIRATSGEVKDLTWSFWFEKFCEHAVTNFTLPVLVTAIAYLTLGQVFVFATSSSDKRDVRPLRRFPQFWLFLMPAASQLLILRGTLCPHQYWERPLVPFVAIAAALGVMSLYDVLKRVHQRLAAGGAVLLVAALFISCMVGTNYYYGIRWQATPKIEMFKKLNQLIPSDKALLSFEPHTIDQFPGVKAASYRPETAWYLDRDIEVAQSLKDIEEKAKTGKYPYYLVPKTHQVKEVAAYLQMLVTQLERRYKVVAEYPYIPWEYKNLPWYKKEDKNIRVYKSGMFPQVVFDLNSRVTE
jgi:4-amino-4-deoxy-L-arabinose transferase-like glycosyltransferase